MIFVLRYSSENNCKRMLSSVYSVFNISCIAKCHSYSSSEEYFTARECEKGEFKDITTISLKCLFSSFHGSLLKWKLLSTHALPTSPSLQPLSTECLSILSRCKNIIVGITEYFTHKSACSNCLSSCSDSTFNLVF